MSGRPETGAVPDHDPLLDAYRVIRRVDSPTETPWPGNLAHSDTTGTVLLVEVEALGENWPGWLADAEGHLMAPMDVVRRSAGHLVVLSPCTERLDEFLRRREETSLSDGERITLAVSVVRGLVDASRLPASIESPGEWWLTEGGRPVFALLESGRSMLDATRGVLDVVETHSGRALSAALADVRETMTDAARLVRNHARLEQALFAVGVAEPLATTVYSPRRAREAAPTRSSVADRSASFEEVLHGGETIVGRLARHVDADLADAFSRATTAVWRRFRSDRTASRTRPLLVAGLAAGVVLAGGLMWPAGGPATAQPDQPSATATAPIAGPSDDPPPASASAAAEIPDAGSAASGGLPGVLDRLLTLRSSCEGDRTCLATVMEDPSLSLSAGPLDSGTGERKITLVDDFGGAAVLRVTATEGGGAAQLVVIVREGEKWLIRDVHDVADQPE
jgi:hypothetical protein